MNKKILFLLACLVHSTPCLVAKTKTSTTEKKIWFKFDNEPLGDVVKYVADAKKANIIPPQGADAFQSKLTFGFDKKISIQEAWDALLTILNISGYTIVPHQDYMTIIKKASGSGGQPNATNKEPYDLFINTPPELLPNTSERIRYIHYFTAIQVPTQSSMSSGLGKVLPDLLSKDATLIYETSLNAAIITDSARSIRGAMEVIIPLDKGGRGQKLEMITLHHTNAVTVAKILTQISNPGSANSNPYGTTTATSPMNRVANDSSYFSPNTKITAEPRTNQLIMVGPSAAVDRTVSFIKKYVDIPLDNGNSVLHVYDLQYLNAQTFAQTLTTIVQGQSSTNSYSPQSSSSSKGNDGEQYFKGVIIASEQNSGGSSGIMGMYPGSSSGAVAAQKTIGNKLVIASTQEDWLRIKKLIEELDKPQLQVAIEVLIVNLSIDGIKAFSTQMRDKKSMGLKNSHFQTNHMGALNVAGENDPTSADALMNNLLKLTGEGENATNLANDATSGSLILSLNDTGTNGIWLLSQLLQSVDNTKIISQPFIVASNNTQTTFSDKETRYLAGDGSIKQGAVRIEYSPVDATLNVDITPMISSEKDVNLSLVIDINEFAGDQDDSKITRNITTNSNLQSGDILVLGGLTKTKTVDTVRETPIFSRVPIVGNLFKSKTRNNIKESLMVFICPKIITPAAGFADQYTQAKLNKASSLLTPGEFLGGLKDPINRWFFGPPQEGASPETVREFGEHEMFTKCEFDCVKTYTPPSIPMPQSTSSKPKKVTPDRPPLQSSKKDRPSLIHSKTNYEPIAQQLKEEEQAEKELKELFLKEFNNTIVS